MIKSLVVAILIWVNIPLVSCKVTQPDVDLNDSLSVRHFITTSTLCEKISFVEKNTRSFCLEKKFSNLVLTSISKEVNEPIFIPYYNGGTQVANKDQQLYLQETMHEFKKKLSCK